MTNRLRASSWQARGAGPKIFMHHQFHFKFCHSLEEIYLLLASFVLPGSPDQRPVGSCGTKSFSLACAAKQWPQG